MAPRLAIGPANYAGQAYAWAEAVNVHTSASAWAFTPTRLRGGGFQFQSHRQIPAASYYCPVARNLRARAFFRGTSHIILDGYRTVFYERNPAALGRQLASLSAHGFTTGLLAHGSDIRDPEAHIERNEFSYFPEGDPSWLARVRSTAARNRELARSSGMSLFVSTPDMLFDLPEATWIPVSVDVDSWASPTPVFTRSVPKVLFIPSQTNPPIKGTRYVDPILRRLHDAGVIDYLAPSHVPHSHMKELVAGVDVVVDQLLFGSYGVAAVEAMAAGRIVIGNIGSLTNAVAPELPRIVNATPTNLAEVIADLSSHTEQLRADIDHNLAFVKRWHDGREAAHRLAKFLGLPPTG